MTLRFADRDYARLPEIIKDLDGLKPRVYVTVGSDPKPIHMLVPDAPQVFIAIAVGLVTFRWVDARPGGMVTDNLQNAISG